METSVTPKSAASRVLAYLVDTDWAASFLNGKNEATDLLAQLRDAGIGLSVITIGEILEGILGAPDSKLERRRFDGWLGTVNIIELTASTSERYASVRADLRARGLLIPDNDIWIAASALSHDLTLVSRDAHFRRVPGLRLYGET